MVMKISEFKKQIRENIVEILSEVDLDKTAGSAIMPKTSSTTDIKKITDKGIDVQLKEDELEEENDNKSSILKKLRGK